MSDHLDVLEGQLKDLEDTLTIAANALTAAPTIIRKAKARIRALRREAGEPVEEEACYRSDDGRCGAHCPE